MPDAKRTDATTGVDTDTLVDRGNIIVARFNERDDLLDSLEPYYWETGVKRKSTDPEIYEVRVPDGQSAIDLIADLIGAQDVTVSVPAYSDSETAKGLSEDIEQWLLAWYEHAEQDEDLDIVGELAHNVARTGVGVVRVVVMADRLPKKKGKPLEKFPLVPQVRNWRNVYPVYAGSRIVQVFEVYDVSLFDISLEWPNLDIPNDWENMRQSDTPVTLWEYWDEKVNAFWLGGPAYGMGANFEQTSGVVWLKKPVPHEYGCLPYAIRAMRNLSALRAKPEKSQQGLMAKWQGTLDVLNYSESALTTAGLGYVNSAWMVKTDDPNFELDLQHGAVNTVGPNDEIVPLVKAQVPIDLNALVSQWQQRFQRQSVPATVFGEGINSNMAGYAIAMLTTSGRRILMPVQRAVQRALSDMFANALHITEKHLGPMMKERGANLELTSLVAATGDGKVERSVKLDYTKLRGAYRVEVAIANPMPEDKERAVTMANALRQPNATGRPLMSDETIMEEILNRQDPRKEKIRIEKQIVSAALAQQALADMAEEMGITSPEEAQQTGMIGPDGQPVMPGGMGGAPPGPEAMQGMMQQAGGGPPLGAAPGGEMAPDQGISPDEHQQLVQLVQDMAQRLDAIEQQIGAEATSPDQMPPEMGMEPDATSQIPAFPIESGPPV